LLDLFTVLNISAFVSFKVLFAILIALSFVAVHLQRRLTPLGALPFMGALEVIFSYRDLRAISLLDKLDKTHDSHEEKMLLGALHDSPSKLAARGLLEKARSPRLATRLEALRAMEALETLDEETESALMDDITANPFTTAYISARILGNRNSSSAIPLLRELSASTDYMLAGEAMIALAKLNDAAFLPQIEKIVAKSKNPRLKIMGVEAFGIYASPDSLPVLLEILKDANPPPYLRDAVILSMSRILGTQDQFYPILLRYLQDRALLPALAHDEAEAALEFFNASLGRKRHRKNSETALIAAHAKSVKAAVSAYVDEKNGLPISQWIQELPEAVCQESVRAVLAAAAANEEFAGYERLHLLIVHWTAHALRNWTKKLKQQS